MASYSKTVGTGYRLQAEYSYTQDIPNNKTKITQKLYWMSLGSSYTVSSSASKSGWQEINGSRSGFSGAGLASLSGNQKKLLDTHIIDVTHNAAGDKTVLLEASFTPDVSLGGSNPGAINISKSIDLPKIPRASSLTSSKNWVAGGNLGITISRASSSFDHRIEVIVDGVPIVTKNDIGSSTTISFTEAQNKSIFNELNGSASKSAQIKLTTFNGSSQIGSTATYPGTVTSPNSSTTASSMNFNIGSSVGIKLSRANSKFLHTLRFYTNNTLIKTVTGVETEYTWTPSTDEKEDMYKSMSKVNSATSKVEINTFYSGEKVKGTTSKTGTVKVINSNPTFSNGFTYRDTNPDTVDLTDSDQYIIQNKSKVQVTLPVSAKATPKNGATIVKYQATIQGVLREVNHSDSVNMVFPTHGILSITDNTTLQVKAIDSRGNSTTTTKTISLLPYEIPVMTLKAERVNGFEEKTKLFLNGIISLLNIDGTNINSIQGLQYRYKLQSVSSYEMNYENFNYTTNGSKYTATTVELLLDSTKAYDIEVRLQDKLGTYMAHVRVGTGQPILFMDSKLKSVGVGKFPTQPNLLDIGGNGHLLSLNGTDHVFLTFYAKGIASRSGWLGYGSGTNNNMNLRNEIGVVSITGVGSSGGNVPVTVVQEGWITPSFVNSWSNYGGGYETAGYRKTSHGTVRLNGLIKGGSATTNNVIFTLPSGYRPPSAIIMIVKNNGVANEGSNARITISANGDVTFNGTTESSQSTGFVSLSGIEFDIN